MRLWTALRLWAQWLWSPQQGKKAGYILAERCTQWLHPEYCFSEFARTWLNDTAFWDWYRRFPGTVNDHSADRKFFLRSLLSQVASLPGDTAECGVYQGASSYLICQALQGPARRHHLFDSFAGLSTPDPCDGSHWRAGQFAVPMADVQRNLASFPYLDWHVGWLPHTLTQVADHRFCFVHLDVDLYEPTRAAAHFFYERLVPGGILLCDDYGFQTCPGAQRAMDELASSVSEPLIHVPTGQAFLIKANVSGENVR